MFEVNGRSFTTPEAHTPSGHINIAENKPIFAVNKILSAREWLPLTGNTVPFSLIPGNIIALIKENLSVEEAVDLIGGRAEESVIQEIVREERYSLRDERWAAVVDENEETFQGGH